jgi:hypothetical protein
VTPRSPTSSIRGTARHQSRSGANGCPTQKGTTYDDDRLDYLAERTQVQREDNNLFDRIAQPILPLSPLASPPSSPNLTEDGTEAQHFCYCDDVHDDPMEDEDWVE